MTQQIPITEAVQTLPDAYWQGYLAALAHADMGLARELPDDERTMAARVLIVCLAELPFQHGYLPDWARSIVGGPVQ